MAREHVKELKRLYRKERHEVLEMLRAGSEAEPGILAARLTGTGRRLVIG
jgi:hypothetical protein